MKSGVLNGSHLMFMNFDQDGAEVLTDFREHSANRFPFTQMFIRVPVAAMCILSKLDCPYPGRCYPIFFRDVLIVTASTETYALEPVRIQASMPPS